MVEKKRIAIFISGRGSNMEQLIKASKAPDYPAEIIGVISNKEDAKGLEFAKRQQINTAIISPKDYQNKKETDLAISKKLKEWEIDIICLAGYMRLLGREFCKKWRGKIINIHPSLLPAYKGLNTHQRALEAGESEHGCTVHFVTEKMDDGPIIAQAIVPIMLDDDEETLSKRVLMAEHKLYPMALKQVALDQITF